MDSKIARALAQLTSFEKLERFEDNARRHGEMTPEIEEALRERWAQAGRDLIARRTGQKVTELSPAENRIVEAVSRYVGLMKRQGKDAGRTMQQLRNRGLLGSAEIAVSKRQPTQGYRALKDEDLEELSYEQIILDHPEEFSERAAWFARRTLGLPNASARPPAPERNPDWTLEEHILGLDLYMRLRGTTFPETHPEVMALSDRLRELARVRGLTVGGTFRNANGVSMKMMNFRRLDPNYTRDGRVGLPSGNKMEETVWRDYAGDPAGLRSATDSILASLQESSSRDDRLEVQGEPPLSEDSIQQIQALLGMDGADHGPSAMGDMDEQIAALEERYRSADTKVKTKVSTFIERGTIGEKVKKANGYKCQICEALGLDPVGFRKRNGDTYIEAHHVQQVSTRGAGVLAPSNIMTLCANHHRQMHFGRVSVVPEEDGFEVDLDGCVLAIRSNASSVSR
jgi:predicted HNH restriction endonuclease